MENLFDRFVTERQYVQNVSTATIAGYRWAWKAMAPALSGRTAIDKAALIQRIAQLREAGLSPVTVNTYLRSVRAFQRWLVAEGLAECAAPIPKLKEPTPVVATLSDAMTRRLAAYRPTSAAERHVHTVACLVLDTGLRIDEALSLDRSEDIDLDELLLTVRDGKGGKGRVVPLSLAGRRVLFRHMQRLEPAYGSLLFFAGDGTKIGQRNALRVFKRICERCGVKGVRCSFHTLRHTFATAYLRNGGDVFRLQRILGHAKLDMTRRYVQLQTDDLRAVHEKHSALASLR